MKSSLQNSLDELQKREIVEDGIETGLVTLEDAAELLQILEIKMLNEYGCYQREQRVIKSVSQDIRPAVEMGKSKSFKISGGSSSVYGPDPGDCSSRD